MLTALNAVEEECLRYQTSMFNHLAHELKHHLVCHVFSFRINKCFHVLVSSLTSVQGPCLNHVIWRSEEARGTQMFTYIKPWFKGCFQPIRNKQCILRYSSRNDAAMTTEDVNTEAACAAQIHSQGADSSHQRGGNKAGLNSVSSSPAAGRVCQSSGDPGDPSLGVKHPHKSLRFHPP